MAWNFAAGPAILPDTVLARARDEVFVRGSDGACLSERPFSTPAFRALRERTREQLARLLDLPAGYRIIFLPGGAVQQFVLLPMNLGAGRRAAYLTTGYWSARALTDGAPLLAGVEAWPAPGGKGAPGAAGTGTADRLTVPLDDDLAYCHLALNETADGLAWPTLPESGQVPLAVDATSAFLAMPLAIERCGLVYASAQKNLGIVGLTVLVVRDELLERSPATLPAIFSYRRQAEADGTVSTPPMLALQIAALMLDWVAGQGGPAVLAAANRAKAARLYAAIDGSGGFYRALVAGAWRSPVNVCFHLADPALDERFVAEAEAAGLFHLRGHPRVGGIRASLYNAMPDAGAAALADFMNDFRRRRG